MFKTALSLFLQVPCPKIIINIRYRRKYNNDFFNLNMADRKIEIEKPDNGLDFELKTALWIMAVKPGLNIPYITDSEENGKFQIKSCT